MSGVESVIVCEGFDDRAFWSGLLTKLGFTNPTEGKVRKIVRDPWGQQVKGGQFAFYSPIGRFVRLVPAQGKNNVLGFGTDRIDGRNTEALEKLIINLDEDRLALSGQFNSNAIQWQAIDDRLTKRGFTRTAPESHSYSTGEPDPCQVHVIQWRCNDPASDYLPDLQCLERLVIASIVAAYPDRAEPVKQWLANRPNPPESRSPKEFSWSHMAGWYADAGCDEFYQHIWREKEVAAQLQQRLTANGTWGILESLAQ
jgi:hypothetical protein